MAITITKPTIGGSEDTWGLTINTALDDVVDALNGTAGTVAPDHTVLTINGTDVTSTAAELNILDGVTATTAELDVLDGDTSATSTTVIDADRVVFNDDGTMKQVAMSDLKTYINASVGSGSVTSVAMTVPTGLTISGSPITTSGTLGLSFASGYSLLTSAQATSISNIPTTTSQLTNDSGFITSQYTQPTTAGAVGTYVFAYDNVQRQRTFGGTYAGSDLYPASVLASGNAQVFTNGTIYLSTGSGTLSGTWRIMGDHYTASTWQNANLYLRIS